jgi:hypothetical protein
VLVEREDLLIDRGIVGLEETEVKVMLIDRDVEN